MIKKLSQDTWNHSYIGIKTIRVNNTGYRISGIRKSTHIEINYTFTWGCSFDLYYSLGSSYEFVMKDVKQRIKRHEYAVAHYCDHSESGKLDNCIIFL